MLLDKIRYQKNVWSGKYVPSSKSEEAKKVFCFLFRPPNSAISCNDIIACSCFDLQTQAQSISGKGLRYHDQKVAIKNN